MESFYKNMSKIRKVAAILQNFEKNHKHDTKIEKIPMDSAKSMNSFEIKKDRLTLWFIGQSFFLAIFR